MPQPHPPIQCELMSPSKQIPLEGNKILHHATYNIKGRETKLFQISKIQIKNFSFHQIDFQFKSKVKFKQKHTTSK